MRNLITLWLSFRALTEWLRYFGAMPHKSEQITIPGNPDDPTDFGGTEIVVHRPNVLEAVATTAAAWISSRK